MSKSIEERRKKATDTINLDAMSEEEQESLGEVIGKKLGELRKEFLQKSQQILGPYKNLNAEITVHLLDSEGNEIGIINKST